MVARLTPDQEIAYLSHVVSQIKSFESTVSYLIAKKSHRHD